MTPTYDRRVLLAVIGLTPQVITETLYALSQQKDSYPTHLYIITTQEGYERVRLTLLGESDNNWLNRLTKDYQLPKLTFDETHLLVIRDPAGNVISDIRTEADNTALADLISHTVAELTSNTHSSLHVSIAGGRKTMGYYAGYALSLFGRMQDRLSHALVSQPFESHPDFFYPTPYSRIIYSWPDKRPLDTKEAQVNLADIPFVRLRHELPANLLKGLESFHEIIHQTQLSLIPPAVTINISARSLLAAGQAVQISPVNLAFYLLLAKRAKAEQPGVHYKHTDTLAQEFLQAYAQLVGPHSGDYQRAEDALTQAGDRIMSKEYFDQRINGIKKSLETTLGKAAAQAYLPKQIQRNTPRSLSLNPGSIIIEG